MAGLNPLPLKENKAPNLPKGHNYLYEEIDDLSKFDHPFTKRIGIACGEVSENLFCLDFDRHQGQNISEIYYQYIECQKVKYLINTKQISIYKTPSGGYHILGKGEQSIKTTSLARWEDKEIMIETRGQGAYVACFPSEGYIFQHGGSLTDLPKLDQEVIIYLLKRAEMFNQYLGDVKKKTGSAFDENKRKWPDQWDDNTPDGKFNTLGVDHVKNLLLEKGWTLSSENREGDEVEKWIRPNKNEEDGISATFGYKKNMFYVFSDAADIYPLEKRTAYSPFQLLVELEYEGDWKKAKDDLRAAYGMEPVRKLEPPIIADDDPKIEDIQFPINVFPENYQHFIYEYQRTLNFAPDYIGCAIMSTIASCIGNSIKIKVKTGYIDSPIFWFAIVGSRGANKTHPVSSILKPFRNIEKKNFDIYKEEIANYNQIDDKEKTKHKKPMFRQLMISDFTIEALQQALYFNKKGIMLYKDELIGFFKDMNKYKKSGGDEEFFLESFNNGAFTINRKTQDTIRLSNIFINIIGTIQDEVLTELSKAHTDNGLIDRFLFTRSEKLAKPLTADEIHPDYPAWWESKVKSFQSISRYVDEEDVTMAEFTEGGFYTLLKIEEEYTKVQNDENTLPMLRSYYSKLRTYLKRFALLLCVIDHVEHGTSLEVDETHVENSSILVDYFAKSAELIFNENANNQERREIFATLKGQTAVEKILALNKKGVNNAEIAKMVGKSKQYVGKIVNKSKPQK